MPIMPIDNIRTASRVMPIQAVQPVHRPQPAGPRFQLPVNMQRPRQEDRRRLSPGRSVIVHEEGFVRRYGLLPDGTRILISEEPETAPHSFPLPHQEPPRFIKEIPAGDSPDPEQRMKSSSRKLKALLVDKTLKE